MTVAAQQQQRPRIPPTGAGVSWRCRTRLSRAVINVNVAFQELGNN